MYDLKTSYVAYGKNLYASRFTKLSSGNTLLRANCTKEGISQRRTQQSDYTEHIEIFQRIECAQDKFGRYSLSTGKLNFLHFTQTIRNEEYLINSFRGLCVNCFYA
jgi:hypothetical protein